MATLYCHLPQRVNGFKYQCSRFVQRSAEVSMSLEAFLQLLRLQRGADSPQR